MCLSSVCHLPNITIRAIIKLGEMCFFLNQTHMNYIVGKLCLTLMLLSDFIHLAASSQKDFGVKGIYNFKAKESVRNFSVSGP